MSPYLLSVTSTRQQRVPLSHLVLPVRATHAVRETATGIQRSACGLEATFVSSPEQVSVVRQVVRNFMDAHQRGSIADEAELLASELATNAIAHAGGQTFDFALEAVDRGVRIAVRDYCRKLLQSATASDDAEHGRGGFIVNKLASVWGTDAHADGKTTWCTLLSAEEAA